MEDTIKNGENILKKQKIVMKELPERIINTKPNQEVVKVLKKEMNRL